MVTVWDDSEGVVSSDKLMTILEKRKNEKDEETLSSLRKRKESTNKEEKENGNIDE